jgi:4-hydroxy-tetrahydrodipicolinate reductase
MKIALIGYGKMGQTIQNLGLHQGHSFPVVIDLENKALLESDQFRAVDVAIEFTTPASAVDNIKSCLKQGIPVVSGTTGWNERLGEVEQFCSEMDGGLFHASNFSIGVNILFAMNQKLATIMNNFPQYSVSIEEVHHIHKLDAPSGTAISLAEQVIRELEPLQKWSLKKAADEGSPAESDTLRISAIREGEVKGKHAVHYESELDTVTLAHSAKSRNAFAIGALMAAEFMVGKQGIYGMKDMLNL